MDDLDFGATIKGFNPGQKVFNRYSLKKILGRGGMGVVWLAHDGELDRDVALKFLPEIVALDPEAVGDLKRETRRNLDLTHVNIVRIYDFVTDSRTAAISMEYIDGATLSALKLGKPSRVFTPDEIRAWLGQLCEALAFAHGKAKVVHRDLKPANLMLTKDGDLKITDFGIARGISDSVSRVSAQAGGSSGTPLYMSPQQMMGEKPAVSDDIYALGATLYELLTGKPPFYSGNVVLQVREKHPASMKERRKEHDIEGGPIPPEWETVIAACLAKNPADRPQGAMELWRKLSAAQATPPPEPDRAPEAPMPASRPEVSETAAGAAPSGLRRRVQALAGSAALLAGLGTGLLFCWRWAGNNQSPWWAEHWRWVEYSVLTGWIAASLAMVRRISGRDFSWGPWLGIGAAMVAVDVGFSEICDSL
ncbi:MAG TPA: serine/threonine-protein kinase, partial [Lacunisphaera sp.]|nr:serine/threonine-protein kinase [Lacunisphaera sp.]